MPRELNLRGYQSTVMSNDGTQDMFQLLVHRLAGRLNMTRVPAVEELRKATLYFLKTDGAGVYNTASSLSWCWVGRVGRVRNGSSCFNSKEKKKRVPPPRIELGTLRVSSVRDSHYTTET